MADLNWGKVGRIATFTAVLGAYPGYAGVARLYQAFDAYNAAVQKTMASEKIDFHVPPDGSVDFREQVRAEVPDDGFFARLGFANLMKKEIMNNLGTDWNYDWGENMLWKTDTERVFDPVTDGYVDVPKRISMKGGFPNGVTVSWRDYNGDGRVGNLSKRDQRLNEIHDFQRVMSSQRGKMM